MKTRKKIPNRWLHLWVFSMAVICVVSILPFFNPPKAADFLLHLICYFLLATIPLASFDRRDLAFMAAAAAPTMGLLLEYLQGHIDGRIFSPEDMLANNLGAGLGIITGLVFRLIRKSKRLTGEHHE
jgi:VanZ family protein